MVFSFWYKNNSDDINLKKEKQEINIVNISK